MSLSFRGLRLLLRLRRLERRSESDEESSEEDDEVSEEEEGDRRRRRFLRRRSWDEESEESEEEVEESELSELSELSEELEGDFRLFFFSFSFSFGFGASALPFDASFAGSALTPAVLTGCPTIGNLGAPYPVFLTSGGFILIVLRH